MFILIFFLFIEIVSSLDCSLDKSILPLNSTDEMEFEYSVVCRKVVKAYCYIAENEYFLCDKKRLELNENIASWFKILVKDKNRVVNDESVSIYCYNSMEADDNVILVIKAVSNYDYCTKEDIETIEGDCDKESRMMMSYGYKRNNSCISTLLPENESVSCYNEEEKKTPSVLLHVLMIADGFLFFLIIYKMFQKYEIYEQYMPCFHIILYSIGVIIITLYEALFSLLNNGSDKSCLNIIYVGSFGTILHSCSAFSLAQYMYYKERRELKIENSLLFFAVRFIVCIILQIIVIVLAQNNYFHYGRKVNLVSGLVYEIPFCDNDPVVIIYIVPILIILLTIYYILKYDEIVRSESLIVYCYQICRIGLSVVTLTFYLSEIFISKEMYIGNVRIYFALTFNIAHIFSLFIYLPLGNIQKRENLRPVLATNILNDDIYRECFRSFLSEEKMDYLLDFWEDSHLYKKFTLNHFKRVNLMLRRIVDSYISPNASKPITLPDDVRTSILSYNDNPSDKSDIVGFEILDKAIMTVYRQLEKKFPWFLKSKYIKTIDETYEWLESYRDYHRSLQYAIRIRMCENAVTDKETGFSYQMSRGRIANPNSCYQLEDIPLIFGKNKIKGKYDANDANNVNNNNLNVNRNNEIRINNEVNPMTYEKVSDSSEATPAEYQNRTNMYIPATNINNDLLSSGGVTPGGNFATLGTEFSVAAFPTPTHRTNTGRKSKKTSSSSSMSGFNFEKSP